MKAIIKFADKLSGFFGYIGAWLTTLLVITIMYDVITRYLLSSSKIWVQEMEWHIFAVIILFGSAYTLRQNGHVRVDIIYSKLSPKKRAVIDILGVLILLIPFSLLIIYTSKDFVLSSWDVQECSPDPGGLPYRYILKAMIPFGFILILIQGISILFKAILTLKGSEEYYKESKHH
ncbi:MAG: TRAP transporter small permease subunit [Calditerrivibrio sp.]|nr:TRAP transporter small permease subunit [Calditerrivibrio sp.]MCA1933359.1 TRAP transporter small permease subunit [Calditerrivibrio sp.]MCA1980582.1 TRAP transporter small permease subunit [Calditerrivibrio sp.]